MWIDILELLVDIGLLRADFKTKKRVDKMNEENKEKGIKKKYILLPSAKFVLIVLLIVIIISIIRVFLISPKIQKSETLSEMIEIREAIFSYQNDIGQLPKDMRELIGNRPLRKTWRLDKWGTEYIYDIDSINNSFRLISFGKDRQKNTEDDIVITNDK